MQLISKILMVITILLSTSKGFSQIKNSKTETVKIYGNCEMCKATIEKAGNVKKTANVIWDENTGLATLTYDINKTNRDEILKRIALAGYDNEQFLAPDDVYAKLPGCCQYDRALKPTAKIKNTGSDMKNEHSHHNHTEMKQSTNADIQSAAPLKAVFDNYFLVKDALVKTDANTAFSKATALVAAIRAVDMNKLSAAEHTVWMKVVGELTKNAENISRLKDASKQREAFVLLSGNIYELVKVSKQDTPIYYQRCSMYNDGKGANWLSKDETIKNPYYGAQMLTCGSTVEILDK